MYPNGQQFNVKDGSSVAAWRCAVFILTNCSHTKQ